MPDLPSFLGEVALRSSFVLAATFALLGMLKRASASERHLVLLFGLLIVAFVPVGILVSPKFSWTLPLPWQAEAGATTQKITAYFLEENQNPLPSVSPSIVENKPLVLKVFTLSNGLATLILGGMFVQVILLGRAAWSWQKIRRQAVPARLPGEMIDRVRNFAGTRNVPPVFASDQIAIPLLAGWLSPAILLPADAPHWPSDRLAMALYHELAHFRRGDSVLLPLICVLRVLYWWHPLVWLALARLRRERENACDDLVLNQDFRASDYADLIVATARQARDLRWQGGALAMASPSHLGERIRAILNPRLNRRPAGRATLVTGLILALALGWFFVAAQVQAEDQPATPDPTAAPDASQVQVECKLIEIDEKTYQQQPAAIDAAIKNGDLAFLHHLQGVSIVSNPNVIVDTKTAYTADISLGKNLIQGENSTSHTILAVHPTVDANGAVTTTPVTSSTVPGPSKTFLGLKIIIKPSLSDDGTILLPLQYTLGEVTQYKDSANYETDAPSMKENLRAVDGKASGFWISGRHDYSLSDILRLPGGELKTLPPLSPSPNRLALIVTARRTEAKFAVLVSTSSTDASKPQINLEFKLISIDEKTYLENQREIDATITNSDLPSLMDKMNKMPGASVLSAPSVTTQEGLKADVDVLREMSYPTKFDKDKDGNMVPSDIKTRDVGLSIEAKPTLQPDQHSVLLKYNCTITNFGGWKDIPSGGRQPVFDTLTISSEKIIDKQSLMVWAGKEMVPNQPPDPAVPYGNDYGIGWPSRNDTSPKRILLIITAHPVPAAIKAPASASNPPSKVPGPKPAVTITARIVEVDEKAYQSQAQAMDEAVRNGDIHVFANLGDEVRETDICLLVGQPGWYSDGEVKTYVDSASRENRDGKLVTVLHTKQTFFGLNANFTWSKNGTSLDSAWSVAVPLGFDPVTFGPDIPPDDIPSPSLIPRMHTAAFADKMDWEKAPGKMHAFWVGDSYGWVKIFSQRLVHGGTLDDMIKSESPSRLAVFMTAQLAKN